MPNPDTQTRDDLLLPVQFLKGVGPERAALLQRLRLETARDVLFFFPRDYQDLTDVRPIAELHESDVVSVRGVVEEIDSRRLGGGKTMFGVLIRQGEQCLRGVWFNQSYLLGRFAVGQHVVLSGKVRTRGYTPEIAHPKVQWLEGEDAEAKGRLLPVYPLTSGLNQGQLRRVVKAALEKYADGLDEVFPPEYLKSFNLWPIHRALEQVHFPVDRESLSAARRRFIYQELFVWQLALAVRARRPAQKAQAPALPLTAKIDARIRRLFPFELTAAQNQVIAEIAADMGQTRPMNRLLQGDVGSGKTIVAVYAMLQAVAHGHQAVLMAPTEVLANQHAESIEQLLADSSVRRGRLTGGLAAADKKAVLAQIQAGELDLLVGTQAVLESNVQFPRLGLVVIDEQHKFGVSQRAVLKQAGPAPHYLVMTATPIPRTVAMTLYGDLELSKLSELPPGRQPVKTYLVDPAHVSRWWDFYARKLRQGRQGYVIVPRVEGSELDDKASLEAAFEELANGPLEGFRLGLLHGRMAPAEKAKAMEAFRSGRTQALLSTTVVEVGVDVPNATLMSILGSEQFGLSQLHQLRGRIGRGSFPGFCGVFHQGKEDEAMKRLEAFAATTDGFELAEIDFALRGPGELLGTRQHGLPPLRIADYRRDAPVLEETRRDALAVAAEDPGLTRPEHALLRRMLLARYGRVLNLGDVG
jgi:ATP-dependent DNA helicase RecG